MNNITIGTNDSIMTNDGDDDDKNYSHTVPIRRVFPFNMKKKVVETNGVEFVPTGYTTNHHHPNDKNHNDSRKTSSSAVQVVGGVKRKEETKRKAKSSIIPPLSTTTTQFLSSKNIDQRDYNTTDTVDL